jgi:serine/threonine protein kinase
MPKETTDPQAITRVSESSKIIGKYELLELIGDGAEGRIFKARCIEEGVTGVSYGEAVALKRLRNTGHDQQSLLFDRQTKILRSLTHQSIISYKDLFVWQEDDLDHEVYCLVTELLEGKLSSPDGKKFWPRGQSTWSSLTLLALTREHSGKSVVHRDLKPSTFLRTVVND